MTWPSAVATTTLPLATAGEDVTGEFRSKVRARGPVEWPAPGLGDRQDEHVLLVLFDRDHVGEPLDGRLADQPVCGPCVRPCRVRFWSVS